MFDISEQVGMGENQNPGGGNYLEWAEKNPVYCKWQEGEKTVNMSIWDGRKLMVPSLMVFIFFCEIGGEVICGR